MGVTPMMQQYLNIKKQNGDAILFFRLGDFYEMFFDDAITASRELDLTLTGKDCGLKERAPMCGVPYHAVEGYVAKLIKKGYRVAICEQMEDPKLAKGLVERQVIRVITPGTVIEQAMLDDRSNNFLVSVCLDGDAAGLALCFAQWGISRESRGSYDSFRLASLDDHPPYLVTETPRGACKQRGDLRGFYTTAMRDDYASRHGSRRIYHGWHYRRPLCQNRTVRSSCRINVLRDHRNFRTHACASLRI